MSNYVEKNNVLGIVRYMQGDYASAFGMISRLPTIELADVESKLICDPLSADKPEAIGPEVRRKVREMLMEELETRGLIHYQMFRGVLFAGIRAAAPKDKT